MTMSHILQPKGQSALVGIMLRIVAVIVLAALPLAAQEIADPIPKLEAAADVAKETVTDDANKDNDLDALLDLADEDPEQLSQVQVQNQSTSIPQSNVEEFATSPSLATEVTTVSRQASTVGRSPAAVFVITNEMIRRSGAQSIPDVLRMAPGVSVARIDANKWAISIRGFNGRFANKLLVQIDGRTVYTPLFGGVLWDAQDVILEDIDRIEVVRGPGATVWGANAVNGVINIITKPASETQGLYAKGVAGSEERGTVSLRYGGQVNQNWSYRIYGKWFDRERAFPWTNAAHDDWSVGRGGFRSDWTPNDLNFVTLQGDIYNGYGGQNGNFASPVPPFSDQRVIDKQLRGGNALLRWTHYVNDDSDWSLQAYFDRAERFFEGTNFGEKRDIYDLDFQSRFRMLDRHRVVWGAGYRYSRDNISNDPFWFAAVPPRRFDDLFSLFVQDEVQLNRNVYCTLGCKFSYDDYTGYQYQPTMRWLWTPSDRQSIWTSISKAIRSPSRAADDMRILIAPPAGLPPGVFPQIRGDRTFVAEELTAYEIGMRAQPNDWFSWDVAAYYHEYDNLSGLSPGAPFLDTSGFLFAPQFFDNVIDGYTYGFELFGHLQMTENWSLSGNYTRLQMHLSDPTAEGDSPRHQAFLQSSYNLANNWECDLMWRYVDALPAQNVEQYNVMDARIGWRATRNLELGVVGRNLFDSRHPEFGNDPFTGNFSTQVEREVFGYMILRR